MKHQKEPASDRPAFLEAMSRVTSAVSIVTTDGSFGRAGATISSLVSISADTMRPTVLICLKRDSRTALAVREHQSLCINVLGADQEAAANAFANRSTDRGSQKFAEFEWATGSTGAPRLADAAVTLDCWVARTMSIGLHNVFFVEVEDVVIGRDVASLLYAHRAYCTSAETACCAV